MYLHEPWGVSINITFHVKPGDKPRQGREGKHVPFGHAVGLWIELRGDLAKLGENLVDDIFEFLQTVGAHLRDIVHHHHGIYAVSLLGLLPQDVIQELCRWQRRGETVTSVTGMWIYIYAYMDPDYCNK